MESLRQRLQNPEGRAAEDSGADEHQPHPGGAGDGAAGSNAGNVGSVAPGDHVA